ncbi:MAG TPA: NAD(P)-dependent oxidoreductase [Opitutaceae bacterium]
MRLLVTGASGFVGGGVFRRAKELGWDVRGIGRRANPESGYVAADLTKPLAIDFTPDVVVHAAARSSPWGPRREFERQNVLATQHVLDFCATRGRPHLIYISTGAVLYRQEHQLDLDEQTPYPANPINEYAQTKIMAEQLVRRYAGDACILRPRAVFGPGDTVVFPRIMRALRRGKLPLLEADRTVTGDLIYSETLTEYIIRAIERRAKGIYHVTNGEPVEIYRFLGTICDSLGLPRPTRRVPVQRALAASRWVEAVYRCLPFLGEPPITRFGVSVFAWSKTFRMEKTQRDLGAPLVGLEEGVRRFVAWQQAQPLR